MVLFQLNELCLRLCSCFSCSCDSCHVVKSYWQYRVPNNSKFPWEFSAIFSKCSYLL